MMHNKNDASVQFTQGSEFFMALRRLEKRVWMLQYDDGQHGVNGKEARDFTIRVQQFFDHYLKGTPAPAWMTEGVPARLKGIKTGLELDLLGSSRKGFGYKFRTGQILSVVRNCLNLPPSSR
jgi:Prolyl oligopeptidase family